MYIIHIDNNKARFTMSKVQIEKVNIGFNNFEFHLIDLRYTTGKVKCYFKKFFKTEKGAIRWAIKNGYEVVA